MTQRLAPQAAARSSSPPEPLHLYCGPDADPELVRLASADAGVSCLTVQSPDGLPVEAGMPTVVLVTAALAVDAGEILARLDRLPASAVVVMADEGVEAVIGSHPRALLCLSDAAGYRANLRTLRAAFELAAAQRAATGAAEELRRARAELHELSGIGMTLMTERDPDRLLSLILEQARHLTGSDAGSLYLVEESEGGAPVVRFALSQNDTFPVTELSRHTLPIDRTSLAGYVATTGETINLADAYQPGEVAFSLNRDFDRTFGYRTRSCLVVPMVSPRGTLNGVLQIINRKTEPGARITGEEAADRYVVPYSPAEERLVRALAGLASVAIENTKLYAQIERLFESFVRASVTAIEQRDPATAGHSLRVAELSCGLAEALMRRGRGPHGEVRLSRAQMRELRYAALLHDFGKVAVREEVLLKARKLPVQLAERVTARFDLIRRTLECEYHQLRAEHLLHHGRDGFDAVARRMESEYLQRLGELERVQEAVWRANEPTILAEAAGETLDALALRTFRGPGDLPTSYLTQEEVRFLRISRGTLDESERREIESHVTQTHRFLQQIPWTEELRGVAEIAYGHHEKMDGTGYPRGLQGDQIPVQTRIMTVTDIFDALSASDRPYKKALPAERALQILEQEARGGMLDRFVVETFVESRVFAIVG